MKFIELPNGPAIPAQSIVAIRQVYKSNGIDPCWVYIIEYLYDKDIRFHSVELSPKFVTEEHKAKEKRQDFIQKLNTYL